MNSSIDTTHRTAHRRWLAAALAAAVLTYAACSGPADASENGELTYEGSVRPILKAHCFHCHGEDGEPEGGLDLRLRRLVVQGGDSGAALVPGKPDDSLLYQRVQAGEMPPEDVQKRLTRDELDTIARWIAAGAPTARAEPEGLDPAEYITQEERDFWAFQAPRPIEPPVVNATDRVRTPIDRFLLARLEEDGLSYSAECDARTLLRRACFDLIGLPPSPQQAQRFLADQSPDAYEKLIDRLLNSPHYGERWGRHWLDVAGYADSEGYTDEDVVRTDAYKYRDYVIRSLNSDKPFDQFIVEQLAGDELVQPPFENLSEEDVQKLIATGFLRLAPDGTGQGGADQNVARNEVVAKTLEIVSTSLLGLTVACAQCHNHRYDPIPQADYYRFRAIFEPAYDWKAWRTPQQRRVSLYTDADREKANEVEQQAKKIDEMRSKKQREYIEQTFEKELAKLADELQQPIREARSTPASKRTAEQNKLLKEHPSVNVTAGSLYLYDRKAADDLKKLADQAKAIRDSKPVEEYVRALTEPVDHVPATFVFHRGDHEQPKQQVLPGELNVLTSARPLEIPGNDANLPTTGRRLAYARWLTSGEHPLTARVLVNRVWMHHFGRGFVETPGDFGFLGGRPSHPQLLDWLANEFVQQGWSLKRLHKLIMTSTVYRQSSRRQPHMAEVDSDNRLYARMPVRRLEAEVLRDTVLAITGKLNRKRFGPAVPVMADRVGQFVIGIENLNAGRPGAVIPMHGEEFRRSVYVQMRRSRPLSVLDMFDAPRMEPNCTARTSSTVAPQALMLMNSSFVVTHAETFAKRVRQEAGRDPKQQVQRAWQLAFATVPDQQEMKEAMQFLREQAAYFQQHPPQASGQKDAAPADPQLEALASFCHALLSSNEFLYID